MSETVQTVALGEVGAVLAAEAQAGRRKLVLVTGTAEGLDGLRVLADVTEERARQDARWGPAHDDRHVAAEWAGFRESYEDAVDDAAARGDWPAVRRDLVKIAALAVAQLEAFDRAHPAIRRGEVTRA